MQIDCFRSAVSNHTETVAQLLSKRVAYVAAHREYLAYLRHLLDTATLPASAAPLPNMTMMAAMVAEMRAMHPTAPWLNGVVLGRVLHRVLPTPLLTWHGTNHLFRAYPQRVQIQMATTCYRFPEVRKARNFFALFMGEIWDWSNEFDQWQLTNLTREHALSGQIRTGMDHIFEI